MYQKKKKASSQILYINGHPYSEQHGASRAALRCQQELVTPVSNFQCYKNLIVVPVPFIFPESFWTFFKTDSWLKHTHFVFMDFSNIVRWNCLRSFRGRAFTSVSWSSARSVLLLTDLPWVPRSVHLNLFILNPYSVSQCLQQWFCLRLCYVGSTVFRVIPLLQSLKRVSVMCLLADYLRPLPIPMMCLIKINPFDFILLEMFPLRFAH